MRVKTKGVCHHTILDPLLKVCKTPTADIVASFWMAIYPTDSAVLRFMGSSTARHV